MPTKAEVLNQLERIPDDEPLFLLRAQDKLFWAVVKTWGWMAQLVGAPYQKWKEAESCAQHAEIWQINNPSRVKVPD